MVVFLRERCSSSCNHNFIQHTLNFAQTNFAIEKERKRIMNTVCEAAKPKEANIRRKAFECLMTIASTYYFEDLQWNPL